MMSPLNNHIYVTYNGNKVIFGIGQRTRKIEVIIRHGFIFWRNAICHPPCKNKLLAVTTIRTNKHTTIVFRKRHVAVGGKRVQLPGNYTISPPKL